eukprot:GHVO01066420.1.p1 GENE.GHVO01066420.1~~GHVO01066420.1.p1  ORF type:complete len:146 (+),score=17.74 GHVO01066420.1:89-526(+)
MHTQVSNMRSTPPCFVYYYIPGDHDESDHPNAYSIGKIPSQVCLRDIKESFPLPGEYHFRFKTKFENSFIWIDVHDNKTTVPQYRQNMIFMKALRLSWNSKSQAMRSNPTGVGVPRCQPPPRLGGRKVPLRTPKLPGGIRIGWGG